MVFLQAEKQTGWISGIIHLPKYSHWLLFYRFERRSEKIEQYIITSKHNLCHLIWSIHREIHSFSGIDNMLLLWNMWLISKKISVPVGDSKPMGCRSGSTVLKSYWEHEIVWAEFHSIPTQYRLCETPMFWSWAGHDSFRRPWQIRRVISRLGEREIAESIIQPRISAQSVWHTIILSNRSNVRILTSQFLPRGHLWLRDLNRMDEGHLSYQATSQSEQ